MDSFLGDGLWFFRFNSRVLIHPYSCFCHWKYLHRLFQACDFSAGAVLGLEVLSYALALVRFLHFFELVIFSLSLWSLFLATVMRNCLQYYGCKKMPLNIFFFFLVSKWNKPSKKGRRLGIPFILIIECDTKPKLVTSQKRGLKPWRTVKFSGDPWVCVVRELCKRHLPLPLHNCFLVL